MDKMKFNEDDAKKFAEFLNFIAKHGKLTVDVQGVIDFYRLLSWAQKDLLPKIEANIFEVKSVKTSEELQGKPKIK